MKKKAEELIRELVPELQELKEGCRLINNDLPLIPMWFIFRGNFCVVAQYRDGSRNVLKDSEYTILGSEIHLEHILLAGERKGLCLDCSVSVYDFNKSFQHQSEEFYKFIVKILE